MEILVATTNKGKLHEYQVLLAGVPVTLLSLHDVGLAGMDVEETEDTFQGNAELKARAYAKASGKYTLADDSGLCVDALDGAPGVYSARYGGPAVMDDAGRRQLLVDALKDVPDEQRGAHFECVISLADPATFECISMRGICEGQVLREERGTNGFGYDALFLPDGETQTFAELEHDAKNVISHRGRATAAIVPILMGLVHQG